MLCFRVGISLVSDTFLWFFWHKNGRPGVPQGSHPSWQQTRAAALWRTPSQQQWIVLHHEPCPPKWHRPYSSLHAGWESDPWSAEASSHVKRIIGPKMNLHDCVGSWATGGHAFVLSQASFMLWPLFSLYSIWITQDESHIFGPVCADYDMVRELVF